ncbi:response regulator [Sphingomonas morindae]|uniref:Response regulator n=1 Tax=Sphingomonas morindae TaxID=1541170 RepID=A0ABY4XDA8_9SPHN|nr:response regulator [Sphingomonas morindae]USI74910.1 response regulator [Sphingomonas morindae]
MGVLEAFDTITEPHAARILVVDDEPAMQRMIVTYLNEQNMRASAVSGRKGLLHTLAVREPDLILLDLHLGEDDGLDLLRELRGKSIVPVILITGHRRDEIDRVVGLELGADDYITKPFGMRELLARIRATLRRRTMDSLTPARRSEHRYGFDGWLFDQRARQLTSPAGDAVALTKGEFALLSAFVAAPRRTLSREHLLQATRLHEDVFDRSIDVQILRLRRKLEDDPRAPRFIRTQRGAGYIFDVDVQIG